MDKPVQRSSLGGFATQSSPAPSNTWPAPRATATRSVISDQYVAGFFDGDGSLSVEGKSKCVVVGFYQKRSNDGVIDLISQWMPGGTRDERVGSRNNTTTYGARLRYTGQKGVHALRHLTQHLIAKRAQANRLLNELGFTPRSVTDNMPDYPCGEWLAGYFDADGCVYAGINKHGGSATIKLSIDTNVLELEAVRLVQNVFGGTVRSRGETGNCWRWEMSADAEKVREFFGLIGGHLIVKREQAYFVLACAEMGHFRDGETIANVLKLMKGLPHRLGDLAAEVDVSSYIMRVHDLQPQAGRRFRHKIGQRCMCGSADLYAKGMCNPCWQKVRYYAKKASATLLIREP